MQTPGDVNGVLAAFRAGHPRGLARAISLAEAGRGVELVRAVYGETGRATTIGLTGPPGVGKSTLCSAMVATARRRGQTVGVVSVDPSSPFSHGALLGDRIRLSEHFTDPDVFIRSMASRGHLGGVAGATAEAVMLMDAFGKDVIIVETVGVGQSEVEIAEVADTTIVALQPGSGDSVQVLKAGILEIADVFVVNKADHPMALHLQREIRSMMEMLNYAGWTPKLIATQAVEGKGVDELWAAIDAHRAYLRESGELGAKRRAAFAHHVRQLALGRLEHRLDRRIDQLVRELPAASGERPSADPYTVTEEVLAAFGSAGSPTEMNGDADRRRPAPVRATVKGL